MIGYLRNHHLNVTCVHVFVQPSAESQSESEYIAISPYETFSQIIIFTHFRTSFPLMLKPLEQHVNVLTSLVYQQARFFCSWQCIDGFINHSFILLINQLLNVTNRIQYINAYSICTYLLWLQVPSTTLPQDEVFFLK